MSKPYLLGIAREISPPADAPSNVLVSAWQRVGEYPSKRQARKALAQAIASGGVVAYAILRDGESDSAAKALYAYLRGQA